MTISADSSRIKTKVIRKHYINQYTSTLLTQAFIATPALPSVSVNDLVNSYSVMDVTDAPMKIKVVSGTG